MPSACSILSTPSSVKRDAACASGRRCKSTVRLEARDDAREGPVDLLGLFGGAADDQRRPRLVDEDAVDLVDDGVGVRLLAPLDRAGPGPCTMLSRR